MLKKILFAVAPLMLVASSVMADDSLLSKVASMDLTSATNGSAVVDEGDKLGQSDVDALLGDQEENGEEAIAASFRRFGWGHRYRGYGYRSYGYRSYGYRSYGHHRYYGHHYYRPHYYYTPVYTSYWGCW